MCKTREPMKAVIDRIEHNMAVLLVGEDEVLLNIPLDLLPEHVHEGTWLSVDFSIDTATTAEQFRRNKSLLERLKRKHQKGAAGESDESF